MYKKKINIALLGCGRISRNHIKAMISEKNRCNLVAICDTSNENLNSTTNYLKEVFKKNKIKDLPSKFLEFDDLLIAHKQKRLNIDLLVICTPSGMHSQQTISAANFGINVCTEKPMALNILDAEKMIEVCKQNNVQLFVVMQIRLNKNILDLRKKIKDHRFGKIAIIALNLFWQRPQSYYDEAGWRGTLKLDGGVLMNQASHYIDLLEWINGPIDSVSAYKATVARNIESEDTAVLNLKWANGTLGSTAVTMISYPKNIEGSITVIGDKGSAKIGGTAFDKYEFSYFEEELSQKENTKLPNTEISYGSGHFEYYKNMLDVLLFGKDAVCSGESGLSSIKLINAAYLSSEKDKAIKLNLSLNEIIKK